MRWRGPGREQRKRGRRRAIRSGQLPAVPGSPDKPLNETLKAPRPLPAFLKVPQEEFRAEPNKPNVTVLYTGQDEGVANAIVDRMLLSPDPDFLQVFSVLANDIIPMLGGGGGTEDDTSGLSATKGMKVPSLFSLAAPLP